MGLPHAGRAASTDSLDLEPGPFQQRTGLTHKIIKMLIDWERHQAAEEEEAAENNMPYYSGGEEMPAGEPVFYFVAKVTDEERARLEADLRALGFFELERC